MITYPAIYNHQPVSVILSSVTLTIRATSENGEEQDIHWLGDHIQQLEETPAGYILHYSPPNGQRSMLHFSSQELLNAIKKNFSHQKFTGNKPARAFNSILSKFALLAGIFCGLVLIGYLFIAPWLGGRVADSFSKDTEISLGEKLYNATLPSLNIDTTRTRIINHFFEQLNFETGYPITITVVRSPEVNAFAIPGGPIVVYDAILDNMKTPEELAALLGHEASHISMRHSLNNFFRTMARKMFLSLIIGSDSGISYVLVENADKLKGLEYSRELETEADNNGMKLMFENKVDTDGMVRLMNLLNEASGGSSNAVNFLSTHPVFDKRISNVKEQLKQYPSSPTEIPGLKETFHALYENF